MKQLRLTVMLILAGLLAAACGPDLAYLNTPTDLYIAAITIVSQTDGYAIGIDPGNHQAIVLQEYQGSWRLDPNQPPVHLGDALKTLAVTGSTVWIGGSRTDAAHGDATQESGFIFMRKAGVWTTFRLNAVINDLSFFSDHEGWAVGDNGSTYHFRDNQWNQISSGQTNNLYGIAFRSPIDGWAVGQMGTFLHYTGTSWMSVQHVTHEDIFALALSATDGWAVGTNGAVVRLFDTGWIEVASPINTTNRAVLLDAQGNPWIVGDHGSVFHWIDDSRSWQHISPPADKQLNTIALTPGGAIIVGGNFNQQHLYQYTNGNWVTMAVGEHISSVISTTGQEKSPYVKRLLNIRVTFRLPKSYIDTF